MRIEEVQTTVWLENLSLAKGKSGVWFQDSVNPSAVRWFTAVPNGYRPQIGPRGESIEGFIDYDQALQISRVFYIIKGDEHARDGTGGQRTLQVNVEVQNLDDQHEIVFTIYKAEAIVER